MDYRFGRPFGDDEQTAVVGVHRGHLLGDAVEGDLAQPWGTLLELGTAETDLSCRGEQRHLGRVAET